MLMSPCVHIHVHVFMSPCLCPRSMFPSFHASMFPCLLASMCQCVHVSMCPYFHVSMFPCLHVSLFPCLHVPKAACSHVSMFPCIHVSMSSSMFPCSRLLQTKNKVLQLFLYYSNFYVVPDFFGFLCSFFPGFCGIPRNFANEILWNRGSIN